jgi:hypothetical protein
VSVCLCAKVFWERSRVFFQTKKVWIKKGPTWVLVLGSSRQTYPERARKRPFFLRSAIHNQTRATKRRTMLLHFLQKLNDDFTGRSDQNLSASTLFRVGNRLEAICQNGHANHLERLSRLLRNGKRMDKSKRETKRQLRDDYYWHWKR